MIQNDTPNIYSPNILLFLIMWIYSKSENYIYIYIISQSLGTYNSVSTNGDWGIIKKVPVNANFNQLIYDSTVKVCIWECC